MRHRFAPPTGEAGHPLGSVMQHILRQTELLLQRRIPFSPSGWPIEDTPALEGLEVSESSWDEWTEALELQRRP
ncbi:hypothetical protein CS062_06485 [Roseateles chitinivorans]|uniref:Uncharacterized protein n=1 Tax=Roseateles chitinivorans TaxID=2917965 RepID=A0A2G9CCD6_9BURK|nr:hypothetical protein [Roseateles chitinivorans]PIM54108.1 hypothetical protein CS062_06485 [Roseateles chitinivorans]